MKKITLTLLAAVSLCALLFTGCAPTVSNTGTPTEQTVTQEPGSYTAPADATDDTEANWALINYSLAEFNNKEVYIAFTCDMKVNNKTSKSKNLSWNINIDGYPVIASKSFEPGESEWVTVSSTDSAKAEKHQLGTDTQLYLSGHELKAKDVDIQVKNVSYKISFTTAASNPTSDYPKSSTNWLSDEVPSLCETYKPYFDYFGFAVEYGNNNNWTELYYKEIQNGLKKHANTISLGNEFKPDFVFNWGWWNVNEGNLTTFTGSNNVTTKVPSTIPTFTLQDSILNLCKEMNIHMRGHVLLWHSQTPTRFFRENFTEDGAYVSAEEMDARLEWYIKTVIEHCDTFKLADGTPVIWAWDVANEATSDGSQSDALTSTDYTHWLRNEGSEWYKVYKDAEDANKTNYYTNETYKAYDFVINAFRFANKYAKPETKLVYNDYGGLAGTSTSAKHNSQMRLVQYILDHKNDTTLPTRIDAMGLQSHYSVQNSTSAYEKEITDFIGKGLDVQITELDIASCANYNPETDTVGCSGKQFNSVADAYYSFMQMFIKNRKTSTKNGVSCVTIWGLSDQQTWLNTIGQNQWIGNCQQYPLIFNLVNNVDNATNTYEYYTDSTKTTKKSFTLPSFDDGDSYETKKAFWAVIEAAK